MKKGRKKKKARAKKEKKNKAKVKKTTKQKCSLECRLFPYTESKSGLYNRFGSGNASVFPCLMHAHRTRKIEGGKKKEKEKARLAEDLTGAIWLLKDQVLVSYCTP